jgi:DNA polymerase III epsilon subunit-like protein
MFGWGNSAKIVDEKNIVVILFIKQKKTDEYIHSHRFRNSRKAPYCSVGIVTVENGEITDEYHALIQPPNNKYSPFQYKFTEFIQKTLQMPLNSIKFTLKLKKD